MAGYRVNGPLCSTTAPAIDTGTNALTRFSSPGTTCVFHGTPSQKASSKKSGRTSAHKLAVQKARADAITMLCTRLSDLDAWNKESPGDAGGEEPSETLSAGAQATRKCFLGWFGTEDAAARSTIRERIVKTMAKLKRLHDSDFVPDPSDSDYAYVYADETERGMYERTVHLGSAFWTADDKTRAGTLIHELSHFYTVGHTDDVGSKRRDRNAVEFPGISRSKYVDDKGRPVYSAYGGARAARLAISNPALALKNADSFEFFIEGRDAAVILDEKGNLDTEGFGDFPNSSNNRG